MREGAREGAGHIKGLLDTACQMKTRWGSEAWRPGDAGQTRWISGGSHRGGRTPEQGWSACRPWGPAPSSPLTHPHCQEAKQREFFREDLGEGPDLKGQQREKCLGRSRQQAEGLQPRGRRHPPTPGPGNEGAGAASARAFD